MQLSMHESGGPSAAMLQVGLNVGCSPHHLGRVHKQQALECGPCTCLDCDLFLMCRPVLCLGSQGTCSKMWVPLAGQLQVPEH